MKLEVLEKDKVYHIYNRGINSGVIFNSDENKQYFLKLYSEHSNLKKKKRKPKPPPKKINLRLGSYLK
jgi:hypothetical protein